MKNMDSIRSSRRCSLKKVFLKISPNSQENTRARVSFLITLQSWGRFWVIKGKQTGGRGWKNSEAATGWSALMVCNFIKRDTDTGADTIKSFNHSKNWFTYWTNGYHLKQFQNYFISWISHTASSVITLKKPHKNRNVFFLHWKSLGSVTKTSRNFLWILQNFKLLPSFCVEEIVMKFSRRHYNVFEL